MADPVFADGRADMFFFSPEDDRSTVEEVIEGVGLRPVYVGEDQEALVDALFQLWIALAMKQGRGRRLAFRLLEAEAGDNQCTGADAKSQGVNAATVWAVSSVPR